MQFSCECGSVTGEVLKPEEILGLRFICMCKDCRNYAQYLGKANQVLDWNGGTEVVPDFPKLITQRFSSTDRESLGFICVCANAVSGIPPLPPGASRKFPLKWLFVTIRQIIRGRLKGWMQPNPFFDEQDRPLARISHQFRSEAAESPTGRAFPAVCD